MYLDSVQLVALSKLFRAENAFFIFYINGQHFDIWVHFHGLVLEMNMFSGKKEISTKPHLVDVTEIVLLLNILNGDYFSRTGC